MNSYSQWLPILVVFIAGLFALRQIKSNNITNARLRWLETFKQLTADFFAETTGLLMKDGISRSLSARRQLEPSKERHQVDYDAINYGVMEHLQVIELKYNLLKLNLNPNEKLHLQFDEELEKFMSIVNKTGHADDNEFKIIVQNAVASSVELLKISRYIIKLDWERTKRSYLSWLYYKYLGNGSKLRKESNNI